MNISNWFRTPKPIYIPLSQVSFGPMEGYVRPVELPPTSMKFPVPEWNKMLSLGRTQSVVHRSSIRYG